MTRDSETHSLKHTHIHTHMHIAQTYTREGRHLVIYSSVFKEVAFIYEFEAFPRE